MFKKKEEDNHCVSIGSFQILLNRIERLEYSVKKLECDHPIGKRVFDPYPSNVYETCGVCGAVIDAHHPDRYGKVMSKWHEDMANYHIKESAKYGGGNNDNT